MATKLTTEQQTEMTELYNNGFGLADLAGRFETSRATVRSILVEHGVTIRGRGRPRTTTPTTPNHESPSSSNSSTRTSSTDSRATSHR